MESIRRGICMCSRKIKSTYFFWAVATFTATWIRSCSGTNTAWQRTWWPARSSRSGTAIIIWKKRWRPRSRSWWCWICSVRVVFMMISSRDGQMKTLTGCGYPWISWKQCIQACRRSKVTFFWDLRNIIPDMTSWRQRIFRISSGIGKRRSVGKATRR